MYIQCHSKLPSCTEPPGVSSNHELRHVGTPAHSTCTVQAGIEGKCTVFLFSDTQIVCESFLEDINNMLNSGDVPGMFAQDEKDRVAADVRDWAHEHGYASSKEACYTAFIDRVRENLHIVLTMSPVGESFRNRCRQFPSLINCCTIDWYTQWPEEALLSVSTQVSHA